MQWIKALIICLLVICSALVIGCTRALMVFTNTAGGVEENTDNISITNKKYTRIVSLSVSSDEILLELLPTENIVGVTASTIRPELSNCVEKAKKVGNIVQVNSPESIFNLKPDLVIIPDFVRTEIIKTLKDMGITVYIYRKPLTFGQVKETIQDIAQKVGKDPKILLSYMESKEKYLQDHLQNLPESSKKRIVYLMGTGIYANPNSSFQDICRYAGVKDATRELNLKAKANLPKEQMLRLDPDIIIVPDFNWDGKSDTKAKIKAILEDEAYRSVKAVKNKEVYAIKGAHLYSLSHHIIDCAEDIAKVAYPERF